MGMPGYGDSATWGPVWHPNDPRRDDDIDAFIDGLEATLEELEAVAAQGDSETVCAEDIRHDIAEVRRLIEGGMVLRAENRLELMVEAYL